MNMNKIATGSMNKKLLAALAVLAVAFIVLAAVPAVADSSDAETIAEPVDSTAPTEPSWTDVPIASLSAISNPGTSATWTYADGIVSLTGDTSWVLSADVTISGLYFNDHSLKITSSNSTKRTLTIENDSGKTFIAQGSSDAPNVAGSNAILLKVSGANIAVVADASTNTAVRVVLYGTAANTDAKFYLDADNAAISVSDTGAGSTKTIHTSGTIFNLTNSTFTIDSKTGIGGSTYWQLTDSSVTGSGSDSNTVVGGYFELNGASSVNTTTAFIYALDLNGSSTFTASSQAKVYDNGAGTATVANHWNTQNTDLVMSQLTLEAGTSFSAAKITVGSGATATSKSTTQIAAVKVGGTGGSFTASPEYAVSIVGDVVVPTGGSLSLNRGESITTDGGKITLRAGATLVLDADQRQPVVFTATGESVVKSTYDTSAEVYKLEQVSGNLELTKGSYTVDSSEGMTLTAGTFTIASGAAVKVASGASVKIASASATLVNNGTLAYVDDQTTKPTNMSDAVYKSIVKAYVITAGAETNGSQNQQIRSIVTDVIGYKDEIIDVTVTVAQHYKVSVFGYGTVADSKLTLEASATDNQDSVINNDKTTTGTWTFKMPGKAVTVDGTTVGAYTVSFQYVAPDGTVVRTASSAKTYANEVSIEVPVVTIPGYNQAGYYLEAGCLNSAGTVTPGTTTLTVSPALSSSTTYFVKLLPVYTITYAKDIHGTFTGPSESMSGVPVSVVPKADDGYRFLAKSVTATYTDADGKTVTIKATSNSFQMPAYNVTVSATFNEEFTLTVPQKYTTTGSASYTQTNPDVTITLSATTASAEDKTNATSAATKDYISGEEVTVVISAISNPANTGVKSVKVLSTDGKDLGVTVTRDSTDTTKYTFSMPAQDATLSVAYGPVYQVTIAEGANGKTTVKDDSGATVSTNGYVAEGSTVTITAAPTSTSDHTYVLKSVTVVRNDSTSTTAPVRTVLTDGVYTFTMPGYAVKITTEFAEGFTVKDVLISSTVNGGSVDYRESDLTTYEGGKISFSVELKDGYSLAYTKGIVAAISGNTDGYVAIDSKDYSLSYPAAAVTGVTLEGSIFTYDADANAVTLIMPAKDIDTVTFTFVAITYRTVTLEYENGTVGLYSDVECTKEIADADASKDGIQIPTGTKVYVLQTAGDGVQVGPINATYQRYIPADTATGTAARYVTTAVDLKVESAPEANGQVKAVYSFTLDHDTTIVAAFAKTALQVAKDSATDYIQSIQKSASMSETIVGYTATWAAQADADQKIFSAALADVAAASNIAAVTAIQTQFDSDLLAYLKETSLSYLAIAYNNGSAYQGYTLASADYTAAVTTINGVTADDDNTVQDEADAVVAAYDKAMNARTSVTPTPEPGTYAASFDAALSANGLNILVVSSDNDKLIQKGTFNVTVTYSYTFYDAIIDKIVQTTDSFDITYTLSADSGFAYIPVGYSGIDSSRTVIGASATLTINSLSATTAVQGFTLA